MNSPVYALLNELLERGESAALCTVVKSEGSTPRRAGSKMLVYENGAFAGTVGATQDGQWFDLQSGGFVIRTNSVKSDLF